MTSMDKQLIFYYLNSDLYTGALSLAEKNSHLAEYRVYAALVYTRVGHYVEALRRLEAVGRTEADVTLVCLLLSIYAHKKCMDPDLGVIADLEVSLKQCQPSANEKSLALASLGLYFIGLLDKAAGLAEKVVKLNPSSVDARLVIVWVDAARKQPRQNVNAAYKAILTLDPKCLNALLGDVHSTTGRADQLSKLNRVLVQFPNVEPPLIDKMNLLLTSKSWQQCHELSDRLLGINAKSGVANKMKIFHLINVLGNYQEAAHCLSSCYTSILLQELPDPCPILYDWAKLFARICGRNKDILSVTRTLVKHCADTQPSSVAYLEEWAYQCYLLGSYEEALRIYRVAIKLDDTSLTLLTGLTMSQFEAGGCVMNDQIAQQLDLLSEISSHSVSPHISLLQISQLSSPSEIQARLDTIVRHQMSLVARQPFGYQYLVDLNVDLLLYVVAAYLKLEDSSPHCISLLENLTLLSPGLTSASLLLAQLYLGSSGPDSRGQAKGVLTRLIEARPEYSLPHLMLCLVYTRENNFEKASQHLELALSNDLKLIETPLYNALKGLAEDNKGKIVESIHSLKTTRQLVQKNKGNQNISRAGLELSTIEQRVLHCLDPADLSLVYQKLCSNLSKSGHASNVAELDKYIDEASSLLKGTEHWVALSLMIANVKEKTDPKAALELLSKVPRQHTAYIQAVESMARIYLVSLRRPDKYIDCYRGLVEKESSAENYVRLAEAYLNIQDSEQAVVTYEAARRHHPSVKFGLRLARLFVRTHQFEKAIVCYKEAGAGGGPEGAAELATLYVKLGQGEKARQALEGVEGGALRDPVLAQIKEKSHDIKGAYDLLNQAVDTYPQLRTLANRKLLASYATQLRDFPAAIGHHKALLGEELSESEKHGVHIALTKLYMQINDWKACETLCSQLLATPHHPPVGGGGSSGPHNSEVTARLILADATFRRGDFVAASDHFASIVATSIEPPSSGSGGKRVGSTNFTALARYIEIQRRLATLASSVPALLSKVGGRGGGLRPPGYYYCLGLFEWYSGNPMAALAQFNRAKRDSEWGQQSLHNMVEICLANPEVVGSSPGGGNGALEMAANLIKEMNPSSPEEDWSCKLLSNFLRCSSQDRIEFEMALNEFTRLAQNEGTRVGASLGLAKCFIHQNQTPRARNILKLLAKTSWNFEEADYLESCWLLLAKLHIQDSRPDRATQLIQQTLRYNKSSARSYELMANISESREDMDGAINNYRLALRYLGSSDLSLSLRLASLLLKVKRYAETVEVCQVVLRLDQLAWQSHKSIYEKAMSQLRS